MLRILVVVFSVNSHFIFLGHLIKSVYLINDYWYLIFFSEGSVVADLVVTLLKHPYAEDIFTAAFMTLDLDNLFPWSVTSYYNKTCM